MSKCCQHVLGRFPGLLVELSEHGRETSQVAAGDCERAAVGVLTRNLSAAVSNRGQENAIVLNTGNLGFEQVLPTCTGPFPGIAGRAQRVRPRDFPDGGG